MGPAPSTTAVSPSRMGVCRKACTATVAGSSMAACSSLSFGWMR